MTNFIFSMYWSTGAALEQSNWNKTCQKVITKLLHSTVFFTALAFLIDSIRFSNCEFVVSDKKIPGISITF